MARSRGALKKSQTVISKRKARSVQRKKGISKTANTTVLKNKLEKLEHQGMDISVLYQNRYCDQQEFGVVLCGCLDTKTRRYTEHVAELQGEKLKNCLLC